MRTKPTNAALILLTLVIPAAWTARAKAEVSTPIDGHNISAVPDTSDSASPIDPVAAAIPLDGEAVLLDGDGSVAAATTCVEPGAFTSTSVGTSRFRGNIFRVDDHLTGEEARLGEIAMELRFTGNVQLHFSIFRAPSADEVQTFTRYKPDIVVTRSNNGTAQFIGTTVSPAITLDEGFDYLIGVSWTQTDNPVTTNRGVTVGNDGSGATLPPFLHGETIGLVAINGVTPPLTSPQSGLTIFDTFGAYSMRLCFNPVPGACCQPTATCARKLPGACTSDNGGHFFHGERTSCGDIPCEYGACCGPCGDTACAVHFTPEACEAGGGEWAGAGVPCAAGLCPLITGACCNGSECSEKCINECTSGGGEYLGDFSTCQPNLCAGACCAPEIGCLDLSSDLCDIVPGSTYKNDGTTCAGLTSQQECGGACCATLQGHRVCLEVDNRAQCTASPSVQNPIYLGDSLSCQGSTCVLGENDGLPCLSNANCPGGTCVGFCDTPVGGACCLRNGTCAITTAGYCVDDAGGAYLGDDTTCAQASCKGCCDPVEGCVMTTTGTCPSGSPLPDCVPDTCAVEFGACCLLDPDLGPSCEESQTRAACRELGGRFESGVDCTACPADLGACCRPNAECLDLVTAAECTGVLLGEHRGAETLCENEAPNCETRGACCTDNGACVFVTEDACVSLTGSAANFKGLGVQCLPGACPSGACCDLTTESCALSRNDACVDVTEVYHGDGSTCEPGLCTLGACCVSGTCLHILEGQCVSGKFSAGVDCSSPSACFGGACCRDAECNFETQSACVSADGVYQGPSVPCDLERCTLGSCCRMDNTCEDAQVASQCEAPGGLEFRPGLSCASPVPCERFGACCLPDASCQALTTSECEDLRGSLTPGAACADLICIGFGACCQSGNCTEGQGTSCGGAYLGDGSECITGVCALGSCCTDQDPPQCVDNLVAHECDTLGGLHRPGVTCAAGPSCDQRGACCFEETGTCADDVRPGVCGASGGVFTLDALCNEVPCQLKGACCDGGLCSIITPSDCAAAGGVYEGDQTSCSVGLCRLGACCHLDGTCLDDAVRSGCTATFDHFYEAQACADVCIGRGACCVANECRDDVTEFACRLAGAFDGVGTVCTSDLCANGACCGVGEPPACVDQFTTRLACEGLGGAYQGPATTCTQGLCDTGSCCRVNGTCEDDVFASDCPSPHAFRPGILCNDAQNVCVAQGACCLGDACQLITLAACLGQGGVYGGNGTLCDPADQCVSGACCLTDGGCGLRRKRDCNAASGIFQGPGSICGGELNCARGACCELDGDCTDDTIVSLCTDPQAVFSVGGDCADCDPRGACCNANVCSLETQADCLTGGASFLGVATLCEPNPCQSIAIVSSNPPNCAIDARQPSSPDGTNPAGWNGIELTFDGDTTGLVPGDFLVTTTNDATPPGILSVTPVGNAATLLFDGLIPLRSWICIQHTDSATTRCIAHLPGDVSNDRTSSAPDILFLIDCLNGVRTCASSQCDADRSNVCGPPDILRVIDLLNGAGAYDPWLNVNVGVCPTAP